MQIAGSVINWTMWAQHSPRIPLAVIAMISKGCFWQIFNITIKSVFWDVLFVNPSPMHVVLKKMLFLTTYRKTNRLLVTNREPPEVSLCKFKLVSRTTVETFWGKFQNLLRMQVKTDVTLLFVSAVNNDIFVYQIWTIKLTQSKNIFCMSGRELHVQLN